MKIYFGVTVAGDRSALETARRMVQCLEGLGHEVLTRHLVTEGARAADQMLGPQAVYERDMAWLKQSDIFIAEASGSSFGVGFETGLLLGATNKMAILFYDISIRDKMSFLITGNMHPNCTVVPYSSFAEIEAFIKEHVGRAETPPEAAGRNL
ncbi:MAG: nucleoside 2-deoxyribosyltransferase [Terriglobia bacterium]